MKLLFCNKCKVKYKPSDSDISIKKSKHIL